MDDCDMVIHTQAEIIREERRTFAEQLKEETNRRRAAEEGRKRLCMWVKARWKHGTPVQ